MTRPIY